MPVTLEEREIWKNSLSCMKNVRLEEIEKAEAIAK